MEGSGLSKAVCAALLCIFVIAAAWFIVDDTPTEEPQPTYQLRLDCSNAAAMHSYGLPTKADVMQFHTHGQWGFYQDGILMAFDDLPGQNDRWDRLYEIEPNPAFDK